MVILGMQWFKTLCDINWNCAQLTMQFQHQGKLVSLQGEQISENIMELEGKLKLAHCLNKTFDNNDNIDKILKSVSKKRRPQMTALRTV